MPEKPHLLVLTIAYQEYKDAQKEFTALYSKAMTYKHTSSENSGFAVGLFEREIISAPSGRLIHSDSVTSIIYPSEASLLRHALLEMLKHTPGYQTALLPGAIVNIFKNSTQPTPIIDLRGDIHSLREKQRIIDGHLGYSLLDQNWWNQAA